MGKLFHYIHYGISRMIPCVFFLMHILCMCMEICMPKTRRDQPHNFQASACVPKLPSTAPQKCYQTQKYVVVDVVIVRKMRI